MARAILSILQNASSWDKLLMEEPINVVVFGVDLKENDVKEATKWTNNEWKRALGLRKKEETNGLRQYRHKRGKSAPVGRHP